MYTLIAMEKGSRNIDASIDIAAPPASVFQYWNAAELLPLFMCHQRTHGTGLQTRQSWQLAGALKPDTSWDVDITERRENELIAWKSNADAAVPHTGRVRFEREPSGHTHVSLHVTYKPPLGAFGHGAATLLGISPKQQVGDYLLECRKYFATHRP